MKMPFLTKIVLFLSKNRKTYFDVPPKDQIAYIEKLGEPYDDYDRSYKQYLCQCLFEPIWKRIFLNIISILIIPFIYIGLLLNRLRKVKVEPVEAAAVFEGVSEVIPKALKLKYKLKDDCNFNNFSLGVSDLSFVNHCIIKFINHPYFVLKTILNIAKYSSLIKQYHPHFIIVHAEFAFSSSLLTNYCNKKGITHIDVMHGEKILNIRDSFFRFNECYVWDQYYIDLFISMMAEASQFRIAIPDSLVIDVDLYKDTSLYAYYKYYLVNCTKEEMQSIIQSMSFARKKGQTVKYRPHPRWTDISLLESLVPYDEIEYPDKVSIMQSVANLSYAVGSFTTVLNQAAHSGKGVLLDDVTYKNQYDKLKDLKYILANKAYPKLSEFQ